MNLCSVLDMLSSEIKDKINQEMNLNKDQPMNGEHEMIQPKNHSKYILV
jgi:hypothetical protein